MSRGQASALCGWDETFLKFLERKEDEVKRHEDGDWRDRSGWSTCSTLGGSFTPTKVGDTLATAYFTPRIGGRIGVPGFVPVLGTHLAVLRAYS